MSAIAAISCYDYGFHLKSMSIKSLNGNIRDYVKSSSILSFGILDVSFDTFIDSFYFLFNTSRTRNKVYNKNYNIDRHLFTNFVCAYVVMSSNSGFQ
jgi:hypothetical protein